jgi:Lrp/AsnC family transcriptional regulator, leucine-responsive regulatory protein
MQDRKQNGRIMTTRTSRDRLGLQSGNPQLDDVGIRLLRELSADPRASAAELGRRLRMSAPAIRERIARLEESGIIRGYRLDVDPAALGMPIAAWVRVRPGMGQLSKVAELAARTPQVSECHRISGEDCFLMKVHVPALEALEDVLDQFLLYGQTTSSFIVASPVPPRAPRIPVRT